ncbi:Cyclin, N-terminal domain containing protein [Histomonas meleagridis]|uniref:Cyclin, N-terminal domain containing protein n=1 Tax=Histomonas meleagridis TaxID=135588 RepID=UPI0035598FD3|nr:Cyclin, N-terminal domain containing protein [Histomonas meleagridis]KAH0796181.1 Cyclin, N-terminal domain containing protein [Histomonas meleagridis]
MFSSSDQQNSISVVKNKWTDAQRRIVWTLICKARTGIHVELNPIVATAFITLQRYFRGDDNCTYDLFILMAAALFTSCKQKDSFRPIQLIYSELLKICKAAPSPIIRSIPGPRINSDLIDYKDMVTVTNAEISLLNASGFDMDIELPFAYFDTVKELIQNEIPKDVYDRFCKEAIVDICLVICSEYYLDVPPEVAVAAATAETFQNKEPPLAVSNWVSGVRLKYGNDAYTLALNSLINEKTKTAFQRCH